MDSSDWFNTTLSSTSADDSSTIDYSISGWNSSSSSSMMTTIQSPSLPLVGELKMTRLIVQRFLTPTVVACGVAGNLVNIAVLTRRWLKSSTNRYLTALAFCDVMYLILVVTISLPHYESLDVGSSAIYQRYHFFVGRPLTDTFSNAGVWLTLTFTVERYIGVCHPMRGKVWCTPRRAKYIVCIVCLAAAIVTFPEFFECTMIESIDRATNQTRLKCNASWFGTTPFYSIGYKYANQTLFTFLPLILLLVFNTLLVRQVMVAAAQRRKMMGKPRQGESSSGGGLSGNQQDRQSRDQQRITVMLISVVIVFLLCQLPQAIQHIYIVYYKIIGKMLTMYQMQILRITGNVFNLLVMVNCSANFILYSAFSTKFRATFSRLFCRCLCCPAKSYRSDTGRDVTESTPAGRYTVLPPDDGEGRRSYPANGVIAMRPSRPDFRLQHLDDGRRLTATTSFSDHTPTNYNGGPPTALTSPCGIKASESGLSGGCDSDGDRCAKMVPEDESNSDHQNDRIVTHL